MTITLQNLISELSRGSGYRHVDDEKLGYHHYDGVQFIFDGETVTLSRKHGYDGEEDMSSEWFDAEWKCKLPKSLVEQTLYKLISEGKSKLFGVNIDETYSGRRACGITQDTTSKNYKTDIELELMEGQKPIIFLRNPLGLENAGSL